MGDGVGEMAELACEVLDGDSVEHRWEGCAVIAQFYGALCRIKVRGQID